MAQTDACRPRPRFPRKPGVAVFVGLLLCGLLAGCTNSRQELIESELRRKEEELLQLKACLGSRDAEIQALEIEMEMLQRCQAKEARKEVLPGGSGSVVFVEKITLGRLTGGFRENPEIDGDNALQVLIEPRDADGSVVKAPGSAKIEVFEVNPRGLKSFLSCWEFSSRELRRLWDDPLLGGPAYRILVPWKVYPSTERLKLVVRFQTLDGSPFEAEKEITVRTVRPSRRRQGSVPGEGEFCMPDANPMPPAMPSGPPAAPPIEKAPPPAKKKTTEPMPAPAQAPKLPEPKPASPPPVPPPSGPTSEVPSQGPAGLTLPPMDPPVSFEMKPFTAPSQPILQTGFREENEARKGPAKVQLGLPVKR